MFFLIIFYVLDLRTAIDVHYIVWYVYNLQRESIMYGLTLPV